MYNSLRPWINVPVTIKPYISQTGTGSKVYGVPVDTLCYPYGNITVVHDFNGDESTSNNQLMFQGTEVIEKFDCIVYKGDEYRIKAINTFFRNGHPDIKVVYI